MNEYEFECYCRLPGETVRPEAWMDALFEAGCDDALVGLAAAGQVSLMFCRRAPDAVTAVHSAIRDVERALPEARRVSIAPDLLNLSELAELITERVMPVTRQAMRKYATGEVRRITSPFPPPRVAGTTPLWHADEVLGWMRDNGKVSVADRPAADRLIALLEVVRAVNVAAEYASSRTRYPALTREACRLHRVAES